MKREHEEWEEARKRIRAQLLNYPRTAKRPFETERKMEQDRKM